MQKIFANIVCALSVAAVTLSPVAAEEQNLDLLKRLKLVPEAGSAVAPYFSSVTPGGQKFGLEDLKGKLLILNFWATWCAPCRLEMPSMERLYKEFKVEGLEIVAINFMESPKPIILFLEENGLTFPVVLDKKGEIAKRYGVHALPATFLVGRQGNFLARSLGYKDWHNGETREFIRALVKDEAIIKNGFKLSVNPPAPESSQSNHFLVLGVAFLGLAVLSVFLFKRVALKN